jgi:transcriptional regulator
MPFRNRADQFFSWRSRLRRVTALGMICCTKEPMMYAREQAIVEDRQTIRSFLRTQKLVTLVIVDADGIAHSVHVPFVLGQDGDGDWMEVHVARANPIWKVMETPRPLLALCLGPHAYVRPGWYPAKAEHGKVVPTWAYISVEMRGTIQKMPSMDHLLRHVRALSDQEEAGMAQPWSVDDPPGDFVEKLARGIVGLSIRIDSMQGVWKLNQHRSTEDRLGMIEGFTARDEAASAELAEIMRQIEAKPN